MVRLLLTFFAVFSAGAAEYWVSTTGNNSWDGTASNFVSGSTGPWLTVGKAGSTAIAGDLVHVLSGTYYERATMSHNGSAGSLITFKGEGAIIMGIDASGHDYLRILAFEFTHTGASNQYPAIYLSGSKNCEIIDNNIHDVNGTGIQIGNTPGVSNIVRGNIVHNTGYITGTNYNSNGAIYSKGTNNLVEYNDLARCSDFVSGGDKCYRDIIRNNYMSDVFDAYYLAPVLPPHVDMYESQPGNTNAANGVHDIVIERNFCVSNHVSNGHGILEQSAAMDSTDEGVNTGHFIARENVMMFLGSGPLLDNGYAQGCFYNNTIFQPQDTSPSPFNGTCYITAATNLVSVNNIFYNLSANMFSYDIDAGSSPTAILDGDLVYPNVNTYLKPSETHGKTNDPVFVNSAAYNLRVQAGSPVISGGQPQASATAPGTTTNVVPVTTANPFCGGWGVVSGDSVVVSGNAAATVTNADYPNKLLYFSSNLTWTNNAPVFLTGTADIGALPYASVALTFATIYNVGNNYTVTPSGDARGVWFYKDGIPDSWVSAAPYTATYASGTITAKAYALYAQTNPVVIANPVPPPPTFWSGSVRAGRVSKP